MRGDPGNLHLTSGRLLARNSIWNLTGYTAPLIVSVFSIPVLIHGLGKERFGVILLAWALIGYAGMFDLGLGRALTQAVAKKLGAGEEREIPRVVWTSLVLMFGLGTAGAAAIVAVSPLLVHRILKVPAALQPETIQAFYVLGLSVPVVIASSGLRAVLEAYQRFDLATYLRIPMGVFTSVGPLLVLPFSHSLVPVVGTMVAVRVVACAVLFTLCLRVAPELRRRVAWHGPSVGPLLRFGGWITVSNVVSPLMLYMDRFVIGALASTAAVAYYATPLEVVTKLLIFPGAISAVMFPAFSLSMVAAPKRSLMLYRRTFWYVCAIMLPVTGLLVFGARQGLSFWLGADFAMHSYRVAQFLVIGTLGLAMDAVSSVVIQGVGRPDIPAKLNLIELPLYAVGLFWLIRNYGIVGAAAVWMFRATADALLLFYIAQVLQRRVGRAAGDRQLACGRVRMPVRCWDCQSGLGDAERGNLGSR